AALAADLKDAAGVRYVGEIGKRINSEYPGAQSKFLKMGRKIEHMEAGPYKDAFLATDPIWGDPRLWRIVEGSSHRFTSYYWLAAVDLREGTDGIERMPQDV